MIIKVAVNMPVASKYQAAATMYASPGRNIVKSNFIWYLQYVLSKK
jgi:hypothetical protein